MYLCSSNWTLAIYVVFHCSWHILVQLSFESYFSLFPQFPLFSFYPHISFFFFCSMCNSSNTCNLHVCALRTPVCFVCSFFTFLGVIFLIQTTLNRALLFSHLLLSCWLSKTGGIQTNSEHTANGSCQVRIAELTSLGYGECKGRGGGVFTPLYQAPSASNRLVGALFTPLCTSRNFRLFSATFSYFPSLPPSFLLLATVILFLHVFHFTLM